MTHYEIYYLNKITNVWSQSLITLEIKQFLKYLDLARNCIKEICIRMKIFHFWKEISNSNWLSSWKKNKVSTQRYSNPNSWYNDYEQLGTEAVVGR